MLQSIISRIYGASINGAMTMFTKAIEQLNAVEQREVKRAEDASELAQLHLAEATAAREHAGLARKQREKIAGLFNDDEPKSSTVVKVDGYGYSEGIGVAKNGWHSDGIGGA